MSLSDYNMSSMIAAEKLSFFIVAKLTKEKPIHVWDPDKTEDLIRHNGEKFLRPRHALSLKRAVLGLDAVEGELNLVEIKTKIFNGEVVQTPLVYLKSGVDFQSELNVVIPDSIVELKLVKGTGPVHILYDHVVSAPTEDVDDDEAEEVDADLADKFEVDKGQPAPVQNGVNGIGSIINKKKRKNDEQFIGDFKKFKSKNKDVNMAVATAEFAPIAE